MSHVEAREPEAENLYRLISALFESLRESRTSQDRAYLRSSLLKRRETLGYHAAKKAKKESVSEEVDREDQGDKA